MEKVQHGSPFNSRCAHINERKCICCSAHWSEVKSFLSEEVTLIQNIENGLAAFRRCDCELHAAAFDEQDRVTEASNQEDHLFLTEEHVSLGGAEAAKESIDAE
jgi:hypothetical protein